MRPQPYPHLYAAAAEGARSGGVSVSSAGLPPIATGPSEQFGGTGMQWSPETLLPAAIANCYVLTFRAVSGAALFGWLRLECRVEGVLEPVDRRPQFSRFETLATLTVAAGADAAKAKRLLKKADRDCLIANSLRGARTFACRVIAV